tara:strand:+ start:2197 stop:2538 length:342 start_codon:yes stop_codon:yes gene_type:complete
MAVTYQIDSVHSRNEKDSLTDVCDWFYWVATDKEIVSGAEHKGYVQGKCELGDPDSGSFVAYSDLTEAIMLGWLDAMMPAEEKTRVETEIANQIAISKENNVVTSKQGLPWQP